MKFTELLFKIKSCEVIVQKLKSIELELETHTNGGRIIKRRGIK
jgi:hypothetical protein